MATDLHLVMHGVAIKKHGTAAAVAEVIGKPADIVESILAEAAEKDRVINADGKYMLSPAGQMILAGEYSRFCGELCNNQAFVDAYERFEIINNELKQLITDWQTMEVGGKRVANDHSDADYDEKIIDRLGSLHEKFEPILDQLVSGENRLGFYKNALNTALEKAEDGEIDWVSAANLASYHTVWFEMHEDLLRLLGQERSE